MAVDERRRNELFRAMAELLGEDQAVTMFELLPPPAADLATRQHVEHAVETLHGRIDALEGRVDARIDGLREELLAAFRGELVTAVAGQTRAMLLAVVTTFVGVGSLAIAFSRLL